MVRKDFLRQHKNRDVKFKQLLLEANHRPLESIRVHELPQEMQHGNLSYFTVPPSDITPAMVHYTIKEDWYCLEGYGELWRKHDQEETVSLVYPSVCLTIPVSTHFQFRNRSDFPLCFLVAATPSGLVDREFRRVQDQGRSATTSTIEDKNMLDELHQEHLRAEEKERTGRYYKASALPLFRDGVTAPVRKDDMLQIYTQVCQSWRMLTDVRFKLLSFVPAVSAVALINLLSTPKAGEGLSSLTRTIIVVFGLLIFAGLYIYERRNSELYDDLISRGRRIEQELGVDTGHFRGRRQPANFLIKHDVAINLIYWTAALGWASALAATWLDWI